MRLHGRLTDRQRVRDLGVGVSEGDLGEHFCLARGQQLQPGPLAGGHGARGERLHQPAGDGGTEQRDPFRRAPQGGEQLLFGCVLEQEAGGPGAQCLEDVLVQVERRHHEDRRGRLALDQGPGGRDPVEARHPHIHQDHVQGQPARDLDRLGAVGRLTDDLEVRLGVEDHPVAGPDQALVVREHDADGHCATSGSGRRPVPAFSLAALRGGLLPKWSSWTGVVLSGSGVLGIVGILAVVDALYVFWFVALFGYWFWVLALAVTFLVRRRRTQSRATT